MALQRKATLALPLRYLLQVIFAQPIKACHKPLLTLSSNSLRFVCFLSHHNSFSTSILQAFYAEIYKEAKVAVPGCGHNAIESIEESGKLVRHYTLNVDGLAHLAGCSTWHADSNPEGNFLEIYFGLSCWPYICRTQRGLGHSCAQIFVTAFLPACISYVSSAQFVQVLPAE